MAQWPDPDFQPQSDKLFGYLNNDDVPTTQDAQQKQLAPTYAFQESTIPEVLTTLERSRHCAALTRKSEGDKLQSHWLLCICAETDNL